MSPESGEGGLTTGGRAGPRLASFAAGLGMAVSSFLTIRHFFEANYPDSIFAGSFCDISAFFNCDSSAYSSLAAIMDVPMGGPGLVIGVLVMLGAVFPSEALERTNRFVALINGFGVVALFLLSVFVLGSLCLLCTGYYMTSLLSLWLFWKYAPGRREGDVGGDGGVLARWLRPSPMHLVVFALFGLATAWTLAEYHGARRDAQSGGAAARFVRQYFELPEVEWPSEISPFRTASATTRFDEAPIQIVEYADLLCSDCRILYEQLKRLKPEFEGKINVAFQFFPLDAKCNDVGEKDKHPGGVRAVLHRRARPRAVPDRARPGVRKPGGSERPGLAGGAGARTGARGGRERLGHDCRRSSTDRDGARIRPDFGRLRTRDSLDPDDDHQ